VVWWYGRMGMYIFIQSNAIPCPCILSYLPCSMVTVRSQAE
jgi:hypothetical protein